MCHRNVCLPTATLKWIVQSAEHGDLKCDKWTKFDNPVGHRHGSTDNSVGTTDNITHFVNGLKQAGSNLDCGIAPKAECDLEGITTFRNKEKN